MMLMKDNTERKTYLHAEAGFSSYHSKIYQANSDKQIRTIESMVLFHLTANY